jgi:TetR/AcrR family transcriptional regulator, ethionamide resistance regulator
MIMMQTARQETDQGVPSQPFTGWLGHGRAEMRKRERTRTDLLVAGAGLLAAQPPERLTVAAVCKAAGVAHGTFYLHFSDRNDLAGCVLNSFVDYLQAEMRAAARGSGDATRNATAAYMRLFEENCGLMKCMVVGVDAFPQAQEMFQRLNHEWIETVVRAARRRPGSAALSDAELMRRAYALGGMVDQYLTALFVTNDPWIRDLSQDREAVLDMFTDLWRKGMAP